MSSAVLIVSAAACGSFESSNEATVNDAAVDGDLAETARDAAPGEVDGETDTDATDAGGWTLLFSDDFATNGINAWSVIETGSGAVDLAADAGPPLLVATSGSTTGIACILRQPPSAVTYSELRVDFRVQPRAFGTPFPCVVGLQSAPAARPNVRLQPTPSGGPGLPSFHHELIDGGSAEHPYTAQLALGAWTDVRIVVRFGEPSHVVVSYGGSTVLDEALTELLPPFARPQLAVGVLCNEQNADFLFEKIALYAR